MDVQKQLVQDPKKRKRVECAMQRTTAKIEVQYAYAGSFLKKTSQADLDSTTYTSQLTQLFVAMHLKQAQDRLERERLCHQLSNPERIWIVDRVTGERFQARLG